MSRIGKKVIVMPAGVTAKFENDVLTVNGPKGTLSQWIDKTIAVKIDGQEISFEIAKKCIRCKRKTWTLQSACSQYGCWR